MSIQKSLKNAMLTGNGLVSWANNMPAQYSGKQRQYFSPETRTFTQEMAKYASDFVEAQVQGLDPNDRLAWQTRLLRMADIVKPTAAIQRRFDDYKTILFADRDIEYLTLGSKLVAMGSTWIAFNPVNISGGDGVSVVRRCNAVWNHYDFYGNVLSEPIIIENARANANDSDAQNSQLINKGYFNVTCQYNDATRQIDTNTRLILGTAAYRVTGFSDFDTEFTGDYSSVRILTFSVRYEEANAAIDDMENHVAGGKTFSWSILLSGAASLPVGGTDRMIPVSRRNGEVVDGITIVGNTLYAPRTWSVNGDSLLTGPDAKVQGNALITDAPLLTYIWSSSDESVATVDAHGVVTAVSEGTATITATLAQNPAYSGSTEITVTQSADGVFFTTYAPGSLGAYSGCGISAAYFEDGEEQPDALMWTFTGADETAYSAAVSTDGKSATIDCFGYSPTPLTVTVSYGTYTASAEITLEGF